jgi:flotillin
MGEQLYKKRTIAEADRNARISQAQAHAREVELQAEADAKRVKLEAEANATRTKQLGEAEAAATQVRGEADGAAVKAKGLAEADAICARAQALREKPGGRHQPADRRGAAADRLRGGKGVPQHRPVTVLNGAEGIGQLLNQVIGVGVSTVPMLRELLSNGGARRDDGPAEAKPED